LDGASKETYLKYRKGGDFEKIIRALEFLTKEKKRLHTQFPYVKLQFIIMRHNEHEISKIKELAGKLGVDELCFKTVGIMDYSSKEDIKKYLPLNKNYSRYTLEEDKIVSKKEIPNNCDFIWEEMIINWDGSVVPCCFDMNNSHPLGNAFQEGVKMVWKSKEFNSFRKLILTDKKRIPLCKYCPGTNKETFLEV
jgi:radical SAM protein with 4Fe4S-binding SPASM domain